MMFSECIVDSKGKGLRANKPFVQGELVGTEKPFAFVVEQKWRTSVCHECLKIPSSLLRCSLCKFARYCGRDCQRLAWTEHKRECESLHRVAPRVPTETARFVARILHKLWNSTDEECKRRLESLCYHDEMDKQSEKEFAELIQTVNVFVGQSLQVDHMTSLYQKIRCNSFSVCNEEMQVIGVGLYLKFSLINHSCRPNCVATFCGPTVQIRAVHSIKKDEELTISYIELLQPISHRQKALWEQYHFLCDCCGCVSEEAVKQDKLHTSGYDATVPARQVADALEMCQSSLEKAKEAAREGDHRRSLQLAEMTFESYSRVIHPCSYIVIQCADRAMDSCIELGEWDGALKYGLQSLDGYKFWYSCYNPLLAVQLFRVGKLQRYIGRHSDAVRSLQL
ncbi:histone-lysine N-methyltransferase SMYD3-like isoform X2 [Corticium candelabrum]|nr:histone-lysine N-methyltransferase SMYD3-like isoform X2 [Corticium candelabrum]